MASEALPDKTGERHALLEPDSSPEAIHSPIETTTSAKKPRIVKICAQFKPLLRRFRSFLRTKIEQNRKKGFQ